MKKTLTSLFGLLAAVSLSANPVGQQKARQAADNYFAQHTFKHSPQVESSFAHEYKGVTTYYVFNYQGGGYAVVSADDVATPILAQSDQGYIEQNITDPNVAYWFGLYDQEIHAAVLNNQIDNESLAQWQQVLNGETDNSLADVGPLLTTTWDQGQWYNYYCPTASGGPGGKCWAGCVATTMGQIMKYYDFPAQGVLSHSYVHPTYGTQSANFGTTLYNFGNMGNSASSGSYTEIATLLKHAGVSVDMNYGPSGSGAFSEDVPWALVTYFNYKPDQIGIAYKADYPSNTAFANFLKTELDQQRPLYYSGSTSANEGHAWVCDGYRSSDNKFHMNWGWSGASNGYFAIGALNSGNGNFNSSNAVIHHIMPGNADLIVRITNLGQKTVVGINSTVQIAGQVIKGSPDHVGLIIDGQEVLSPSATTFTYDWNTTGNFLGDHAVKLMAIKGNDTVYHQVSIQLTEWIPQASGFTTASRGIKYIHALDSLVVWATAYDGVTTTNYIQEFTKTVDGGNTWTPGVINNCSGLEPAMIFALNKDTAYCPMYKQTGSNPQGIYVTRNGGTTWTRQTSASFSNTASFPDVVHFFNDQEGFCMGDPINNDFEIYTTSNGGNTWTAVPGANIDNNLSGEYGIVGYYSAIGDTAWFGTNKGRVYRSLDKGLHWTATTTSLGAVYTDVKFSDSQHGIAMNKDQGTTGQMCETFDGGLTWASITATGTVGTNDYCYVPGTANTWVSTEASTTGTPGAFYSFDGGHSWSQFFGTEGTQFLAVRFVNNHCGWGGHFNESATSLGMFKYIGVLDEGSIMNPVTNLAAIVTGNNVALSWTAPVGTPISYNIYRDGVLIGNTASTSYNDAGVTNGLHDYCVVAVYAGGVSAQVCTQKWITLGLDGNLEAAYKVFPNPATDVINVVAPVVFDQVKIFNQTGQMVYNNPTHASDIQILTSGFNAGVYFVQIISSDRMVTRKVSIR